MSKAMVQTAATSFCDHYNEIMNGVYGKELLVDTQAELLLNVLGDIAVSFVLHQNKLFLWKLQP